MTIWEIFMESSLTALWIIGGGDVQNQQFIRDFTVLILLGTTDHRSIRRPCQVDSIVKLLSRFQQLFIARVPGIHDGNAALIDISDLVPRRMIGGMYPQGLAVRIKKSLGPSALNIGFHQTRDLSDRLPENQVLSVRGPRGPLRPEGLFDQFKERLVTFGRDLGHIEIKDPLRAPLSFG